jgi:hypothetical protein
MLGKRWPSHLGQGSEYYYGQTHATCGTLDPSIDVIPVGVLCTCSVHHRYGYGSENSHRTRTRSNRGCTVKGTHRTRFVRGCARYTILVITPHWSQKPAQCLLLYCVLYMYYYTYMNITTTQRTVECAVLLFLGSSFLLLWFIMN